MPLLRVLVVIALFTTLTPATAWPCMNPVTLAGNKAVKRVKAAEMMLEKGAYARAAREIDPDRYEFRDQGLQVRARLIYAVALVRQGKYLPHAVDILEGLHADHPDQPAIQARLAEALIRDSAEGMTRGRELIEDLAGRDLIPDGFGWVTLATVRDAAGDADGADAALVRCRQVARKKAICRLPASDA